MNFVEMMSIHKTFGAVRALDGANLNIGIGQIVGLVGDNAAGKSTLMKVLSGAYRKDSGTIRVSGRPVKIHGPEDARQLGIEMIYQDLALADNLDVAANIFMGRELTRGPFLDRARMTTQTDNLITRLGINIDNPRQLVATLSGGQRQSVAIARAMAFNAQLVIMDEPTASLSPSASEHVLEIILQLKERDVSVVYISHKLDEVNRIADRVVQMSHGMMVDA